MLEEVETADENQKPFCPRQQNVDTGRVGQKPKAVARLAVIVPDKTHRNDCSLIALKGVHRVGDAEVRFT
jgi:hypothetical protein